ncbi:phage tail family protein [Cohnella sp. GbtcB17]|uniref:phage distal tail protein n=1 Tax=Cohnella sp. GbtcB17 TaxID=2824762 RepID=UPI001C2FA431|nr:phage tail family protein [Cohnella sp. GbtcB17]
MFNRTAFGQETFNRPASKEIVFSVSLSGDGDMSAKSNGIHLATVALAGDGDLSAAGLRQIIGVIAELAANGDMTAAMQRTRLTSALLEGNADLKANGGRYHIEEISITNTFAPGEKIIIDAHKLRVTKNGTMIGYDGEFFQLSPGTNNIVYTDTASGRTLQMRIVYRDKYV